MMQFRISSRRKTGKKIPESLRLEFLEKFLANNFTLLNAEDIIPGPLNKGDVENTINNSPKVPRANFLGSNKLFCVISICKFGSF